MPKKWTKDEERKYRTELETLHTTENKSIREIAEVLGIAQQKASQRLCVLKIKTAP